MLFLKIIFSYIVIALTLMVLLGTLSLPRRLEALIGWTTVALLIGFPFVFIVLLWTLL